MSFGLKLLLSFVFFGTAVFFSAPQIFDANIYYIKGIELIEELKTPKYPPLDKLLYDQKLETLANISIPKVIETAEVVASTDSTIEQIPVTPIYLWPVKTVYPKDGAILPFKRIVAYYGNLYSNKMGALGAHGEEEMLSRLGVELEAWRVADPETPVQPALHYITIVAQEKPGEDGKHRLRMPDSEIEKVFKMAEKIGAIVFLDFQVGFSTLDQELPIYEKFLRLPQVHLGIDPEFSMKGKTKPGKIVGTYDAMDVNYAIDYLARLVNEEDLPPKILVVHRYTEKMLTNYKLIKTVPEVQVVIHMDGWGEKENKLATYDHFIYREPVQFTGFKIFYKNDLWEENSTLFTPEELLKLSPRPIYIQYQ